MRTIISAIDKGQFEQVVVHGKTDTETPFLYKDLTVAKSYKIEIQREVSLFKDVKAVFQLIKILKNEKPDLVHAHSAKGGLIARLASKFYKTKVLHTPQAYSYLSKPKGIQQSIFLFAERFLKHFNSTLLASSTSEKNRGLHEVGYKENCALLFNNAIPPIATSAYNQFVNSLPKNFIATVGRPSFQKNIESMLEVIKLVKLKIPEVQLVLMGVGHYSPNLNSVKNLIQNFDLGDNVTLIEWQERENILDAIAASQLYISTARYEGLPYSVIEAMAVKTALLLTDVDGNRDLVQDGFNGYLVPEYDHSSMADHVIEILHNDNLRRQMGENSNKLFQEKFNMNEQIHHLQQIYLKTIST